MRIKDLNIKYYKGKPPRIKDGAFLLPYLTPSYIRKGSLPEYYPMQSGIVLVEDNDLVLLWDGSNAGEFFKGKKGILASTMVKFDKVEEADDDYFFYSLKLQEQRLKSKTAGSGIPHVDKETLYNLEVYLPKKSHQIAIATVLTTIDQAIEKVEQLIAKYECIKTGLMQDLLTRGIDKQGNIRSEETHEFKDSALGSIPKEWEVAKISTYCNEVFLGLTSKVDYVEQGGVPLVRTKDINNGILSFDDALNISEAQHMKITKYRKAKRGDVLISKSGTLGTCAIVNTDREFSIYESIIVLQPKKKDLDSNFLLWQMRDEKTQQRLLGEKVGSTVGHLNILQFRELEIAFPKFKEQEIIGKMLNDLYKNISCEYDTLAKFAKHKKGLMQDLLTGKIRVDALMKQENQTI